MRAAYTSGTLVPIHPHAGLPLSVLTGDGGSLSHGAFCPFLYTRPSNNEARKERGTREKRQRGVLHFGTFLPSTFSRTVGPSLPRVPLPPDRRYTFHGHCSRVENRLRIGRSRCVAVDANARARALHRVPPLHTHRVYIAVRSDDRNDSNHRLTSGIRHSGFRVATPAAIVAVYDCRARSPSLSHRRVPLPPAPPLLVSSLSPPPSRSRSCSSESGFLVSPHLFSSGPLPFSCDFSHGISFPLSRHSSYLSHPLFPYLLLVSSVPFACTLSFFLHSLPVSPYLSLVRSRSYAL